MTLSLFCCPAYTTPPKKQKKRGISRPAKKAAPQFANANEEAAFKRNEEITSYFAFLERILLSSAIVTLLLETFTKGVTASITFCS